MKARLASFGCWILAALAVLVVMPFILIMFMYSKQQGRFT